MEVKHCVRVTQYLDKIEDLSAWVSYFKSKKISTRYHKNKRGNFALWRELLIADPGHLIDSAYPSETNLERFESWLFSSNPLLKKLLI